MNDRQKLFDYMNNVTEELRSFGFFELFIAPDLIWAAKIAARNFQEGSSFRRAALEIFGSTITLNKGKGH